MNDSPLSIGWRSARALLVPACVLLAFGTALVISYYHVPAVTAAMAHVADLKMRMGYGFAFVSTLLLGGVVPWLFRMGIPALRPARPLAELIFGMAWWAPMGVIVDAFYHLLSWLYDDLGLPFMALVLVKVCSDMLCFTPAFASPANALSHLWKDVGFDFGKLKASLGAGWYTRLVLPNLVPNFMVWVPGVTLVYCLPPNLQLPMSNIIGCFWAMMCLQISAHSKGRVSVEPELVG